MYTDPEELSPIPEIKKRSLRKYHRARLRKKRKNYFDYPSYIKMLERDSLSYYVKHDSAERLLTQVDINITRLIDTPCQCSCAMCGNDRKHLKQKTRKEKINLINYQEQVKDYFLEKDL